MRRRTHTIGALVFGILGHIIWHFLRTVFFLPSDPSLVQSLSSLFSMEVKIFLIMILSSLFGGTLPDILDPPFSSRHRFLAHSKLLLCIFLVMWIASLFVLLTDPNSWIWTIYFFLLGYISHLLLDSLTPAGLH